MTAQFKIPSQVKANARRGLELRKQYRRGGTTVGINTAETLVRQSHIGIRKLKHILAYFPRHEKDNLDQANPPSNGYIAWLLWGGWAAWAWSNYEVAEYNKRVNKKERK